MVMKNFYFKYVFYLLLICLCACTSNKRNGQRAFDMAYSLGNYQRALDGNKVDFHKSLRGQLIELLQRAMAYRALGDYSNSNKCFNYAEKAVIQQYDDGKFLGDISATLFNDTVLDYRASEFEAVMINTYKALNYWQLGQMDDARVEFNRAIDRQRRAKDFFAKEINKVKAKLKEYDSNKSEGVSSARSIMESPELKGILASRYHTLDNFKVYKDFINPYVSYIAGLFFIADKDYNKATDLLKQAYAMEEGNSVVRDDFEWVEKHLDGVKSLGKKYVWLIAELGMAPKFVETRINIPVFLVSNKVMYVGIALPKLVMDDFIGHITMLAKKSQICASMDRVVQAEFKKRFKIILTRAILGAIAKVSAQYFANKSLGDLGSFAMAIYQFSTISSDTRSWRSLPKQFELIKTQLPADGKVDIKDNNGHSLILQVPKDKNSVIFLRKPSMQARLNYQIFSF